ncbi:manganese efflux pump [Romboutsia sp.]|uniref:manganese efflux pump n=1 Tax=Romboutsia sp. TaxID=1965302 RepID=UPI003F39B827
MFLGSSLQNFLSPSLAPMLSFILLLILGIYRLFETFSKGYIKKISNMGAPLTFKLFDFKFVLEIYADETKADYDGSKILSSKEAFYLATALSLDSLAVGFGCSLGNVNKFDVIVLSFIIGLCLLKTGSYLGKYFAKVVNINLSWMSGVMLIILAIIRII